MDLNISKTIRILILVNCITLLFTIILAANFFDADYIAFRMFVSDLGVIINKYADPDVPNLPTKIIFRTGLIFCAIVMLITGVLFFLLSHEQKKLPFPTLTSLLNNQQSNLNIQQLNMNQQLTLINSTPPDLEQLEIIALNQQSLAQNQLYLTQQQLQLIQIQQLKPKKKERQKNRSYRRNLWNGVWSIVCGIGIFGVAFPADNRFSFNWCVHIGGTALFFGFFILLNFRWQYNRIRIKKKSQLNVDCKIDIIWASFIIITAIIFVVCYLAHHFAGVEKIAAVVSQKVAIIEIIISGFLLDMSDFE